MKKVIQNDERILHSDIFERSDVKSDFAQVPDHKSTRPELGSLGYVQEDARQVPVFHRCQVLVVGGGPSGTAAAIAAARQGASVCVLERYNHLGGLSTGGLVIWIDRMSDWQGQLVIRGLGEEFLNRLPPEAVAGPEREEWGSTDALRAAHWQVRTAAFHGVVTWSPTIDPEHLKLLSQEMLLEQGVRLLFHSHGSIPVVRAGKVEGMIFDSKQGRMAVLADVVIDCTGDGDVFARAGAAFEDDIQADDIHHCANTSWLYGGVDMNRWLSFRAQPEWFANFMAKGREAIGSCDKPFVSWRNDIALFMGPRQSGYDALDVDDISALEIRSHRAMLQHLNFYKAQAPGFENAYLLQSAPQLGVRHTRRLKGMGQMTRAQWPLGTPLPDEVGVSPAVSPKWPNISIPYGCLVPAKLNGLLAAGRHISCDPNTHGFMREIPQCWITGQAAGTAAALAVQLACEARDVPISVLQSALLKQSVYLRAALP